jgi:hypothetical protein
MWRSGSWAVAAAIAALPSALSAQPISGAEAGWAAMARCAQIHEAETRRDCTDGVLTRGGLLQAPPAASEPPKHHPTATKQARAEAAAQAGAERPAAFGLPQRPVKQTGVQAALASAEVDGEGKLVLVTQDGAVWRAVESDPRVQAPKPGDMLTIRRTTLGGYNCRVGRWLDFLCLRQR